MPSPDQFNIVFLFLSIGLILLTFYKPVFGVIGYMIMVYGKVAELYPVISSIRAELIFGILLLVRSIMYENGWNSLLPSFNKVNKYLFFFIGSVILSYIFAWDKTYSWDIKIYHFIKVLFLYFMLLPVILKKQELKIFVWFFIGFYVLLSYEPFYGFFTGTGGNEQTYGTNYIGSLGLLSGHVALANNMNQMIPIAFFLMLSVKRKLFKILALVPVILFITALIGSGSRGGVVGFGVFSFVVALYSKKRIRNLLIMAGVFVLLLATSKDLSSTAGRIDAGATEGRLVGLTHGLGMLFRGNIFGVGPGCYLIARQEYFGWYMESHNIYGQILGDLGIPGTVSWAFFIFFIFKNLSFVQCKTDKESFLFNLSRGIQVSIVVRLAISMASHGLYFFYWYVVAAISIAMVIIVNNETDTIVIDEQGFIE